MAKLSIKPGSTSQTILVQLVDKTTALGKTGITYSTGGATAYYARPGVAAASISLITQTVTGAYSSGGFVEIDATNMPGLYRLDIPDAAIASGKRSCTICVKATDTLEYIVDIDLSNQSDVVAINSDATAASNLALSCGLMLQGTAYAGTLTTTSVQTQTAAIIALSADRVIGRNLGVTSGGQQYTFCRITDFASSAGTATITLDSVKPLVGAMSNGETFLLV